MDERGSRALRLLDKWLGIPLTVPAAIFRRLEHGARARPTSVGIFCPGAIGDLLLLSALVNGIKKAAPAAAIEIIASRANAAALPLLPNIDSSFATPIGSAGQIVRRLRQRRFDLLIDASQWARLGSLVTAFSGARMTVGFRSRGQWRSLPYDIAVEHRGDRHETGNFLALGCAIWPGLNGAPSLALPPKGRRDNIIYCHFRAAPGRGRMLKEWPQEYWARLISACLESGHAIRLSGAPADAAYCEDFLEKYFPGNAMAQSIAGVATLPQLADLFQNATAVVSVNTGIMHLAALTGAPTVGLHGATNPLRWGPVGERAIALLPRRGERAYLNLGFEYPPRVQNAMPFLPVEDVLAALCQLDVAI